MKSSGRGSVGGGGTVREGTRGRESRRFIVPNVKSSFEGEEGYEGRICEALRWHGTVWWGEMLS